MLQSHRTRCRRVLPFHTEKLHRTDKTTLPLESIVLMVPGQPIILLVPMVLLVQLLVQMRQEEYQGEVSTLSMIQLKPITLLVMLLWFLVSKYTAWWTTREATGGIWSSKCLLWKFLIYLCSVYVPAAIWSSCIRHKNLQGTYIPVVLIWPN